MEDRVVSGTAGTRSQVFIVRAWYEAQEASERAGRIQDLIDPGSARSRPAVVPALPGATRPGL